MVRDPHLLSDRGVELGCPQREALGKLGKPYSEITLRRAGRLISVVEYDAEESDYRAVYEGDDMSILAPQSGVRTQLRRELRLIFIDNVLCSIEDLARRRYWAVTDTNNQVILQEIQQPR